MEINIGNRLIGIDHPTYFIADIAANHDGDIDRAKTLIELAKESGAEAAKFQNFKAGKIVSDYGFRNLGGRLSHQATWDKSVFEVYSDASVPDDWSPILKEYCDQVEIHYLSSPYDFDAIDMLDDYMPAYKAGSGLMSWPQAILRMAEKDKPLLIATGAAELSDVIRVMEKVTQVNNQIVLMQCNTNYTASPENYKYLNLNVLKTFSLLFPDVILGLSDHTHGLAAILGAVTLGARVIERHFTDNNDRQGPDHKFATNPHDWKLMVDETRNLENALGSTMKFVAGNEDETYIVQRRALCAAKDIKAGQKLTEDLLIPLRPNTPGSIQPWELDEVLGKTLLEELPNGKALRWEIVGN